MRNYLSAECYKVFHRSYFYVTLLVCLALEGLLLWGSWLTLQWGNASIDFCSTALMIPVLLGVGMYATLLTADMVFSDQYKYNTMKNEVSYGLSRTRIYVGKLLVSLLVSLVAAAVMVGFYLLGCWVLYPHNELDQGALSLIGYTLSGALPLWFGAQAVSIFCYFHVRSSTVAAFAAVGILGVLPSVLQAFGLLFHPVFEVMRQFTPSFMLDNLKNMAFDGSYLGLCWASGLVWCAVFTAAGLALFRKKEIR
ncbi:ABC transporter permease subunit [Pseudoflavonifractor phocaeensis]|uniref:ABC transporter permease subunit n=1 Tax=Pseudoflavonifractor phocaeensis TaxID=1870988 RepID=UPI00195C06D5|nr:ABC transporter permease subunit [Pseudoflavonifractor phocaeensis]MBM6869247.1 ABC transporter permease subunit [Pseudoflavonifractor phocaeensis]MBM6936995.1 ABC transporter permease subunit [Pseudoflavonifractor phocaeensis]